MRILSIAVFEYCGSRVTPSYVPISLSLWNTSMKNLFFSWPLYAKYFLSILLCWILFLPLSLLFLFLPLFLTPPPSYLFLSGIPQWRRHSWGCLQRLYHLFPPFSAKSFLSSMSTFSFSFYHTLYPLSSRSFPLFLFLWNTSMKNPFLSLPPKIRSSTSFGCPTSPSAGAKQTKLTKDFYFFAILWKFFVIYKQKHE